MDPNDDKSIRYDIQNDGVDLDELISIMGQKGQNEIIMYAFVFFSCENYFLIKGSMNVKIGWKDSNMTNQITTTSMS